MRHFYRNIGGWFDYGYLYDEAVDLSPPHSKFIEVGSWKGRSASYMGVEIKNSRKHHRLFCVDTWAPAPEPWYKDDPDVKAGTLFETFLRNTQPVSDVVFPIRASSVEAAKKFADNSIQFILIDGTHDYENVKADIKAWLPKICSGGWLAGDDIDWPGVKEAVEECLGSSATISQRQWRTKLL